MPPLYLTPASLGYLSLFILSLVLSISLVWKWRQRRDGAPGTRLLAGFIFSFSLFILCLFFATSLPNGVHLVPLTLALPALALSLAFLLQYTCRHPVPAARNRLFIWISLVAGLLLVVFEVAFSIYRLWGLAHGQVVEPPALLSAALLAGALWGLVMSLLGGPASENASPVAGAESAPGSLRGWRRFFGADARAIHSLAGGFLLFCGLCLVVLLANLDLLSPIPAHILVSAFILLILSLFILIMLQALPGTSSLPVILVGAALVIVLGILGVSAWVSAPVFASSFSPSLPGQQTLRFTPNGFNGYDMTLVPYHFSQDWGDPLSLEPGQGTAASQAVDFPFTFFGQPTSTVYVGNNGLVGLDGPVEENNLQAAYGNSPAIFCLYMDLVPEAGGIYVSQAGGFLLVTWEVSNYYHPEERFSFQLALYPDGAFEMSYESLPTQAQFFANDRPQASPWLIGAVPGGLSPVSPQVVDFMGATPPVESGPQGFVMDYQLAFRQYLHRFLLPLLIPLLAGVLLAAGVFPWLIHARVVKPLGALLAGLRKVEAGDLEAALPVTGEDELGAASRSFNAMAARLRANVTDLEENVSLRTRELLLTNQQLQAEIVERESAHAQVVEQQRRLAVAEEHEHMERNLHDGLGQAMGYLNMETSSVQALLEQGQTEAALTGLQHVAGVAQNAQARIRDFILGLRVQDENQPDLFATLEHSLRELEASQGIQAVLSIPPQAPSPLFSPVVETQAAYIISEALNNVRQHAHSQRVEVLISLAGEMAQVIISDDGVGFDPASVPGEGHNGLNLMHARAESAGGRLEVRSAPGKGSLVLALLPRRIPADPNSPAGSLSQLQNMRLMLVDSSPLFLEGLRNLLLARGVTVVGVAHDGQEAVEKARLLHPDGIVMELEMPRMNGLEATRQIKIEMPAVKIVMLTTSENEEYLFEALRNGASGYLLKSLEADAFCQQLAGLARGEAPLPPAMASLLVHEFSHAGVVPAAGGRAGRGVGGLNARQWQILDQVAQGLTYREVAGALSISEATVKYHMGQILDRLGLKNREQAVAFARKLKPGK